MVTLPSGATGDGSVIVGRERFRSGAIRKLAFAPLTEAVLISALGLMRKLTVEPEPWPTFRKVKVARALRKRSLPSPLTAMSNFVTCHAARKSSCAGAAGEKRISKKLQRRVR